jgi:hypothetical protein
MLIEKVIERAFGLLPGLLDQIPRLNITIEKPEYSVVLQVFSADSIKVGLGPKETTKVEIDT